MHSCWRWYIIGGVLKDNDDSILVRKYVVYWLMDNLNYYELYLMSRAVFTCDPRTTNIVTLVAVELLIIDIPLKPKCPQIGLDITNIT